jgi:all-trans-retinol 13,14-reductase
VGTPITNKYYLGARGGEMYGLDHNISRFTPTAAVDLRPETPVSNLFLTGQDVFTAGFVGAAFGGLLCASSVLNRNIYEDLTLLKKKSPPCKF